MQNTIFRAISAAVVSTIVYAAGWVATHYGWQFFVDYVNHFNRNWLLWLLVLSGIIALVRKFILRSKVSYFLTLYVSIITYALIFQTNWFLKDGSHPTFLFIWTYLFLLTLICLFGLELLRKAAYAGIDKLKPELRPWGWFFGWIIFNAIILFLINDPDISI